MMDLKEGVVVNCLRLVLRDAPSLNANPIRALTCLTEVEVDIGKSDESFFCVIDSLGREGFCLRRYIALREQR